MPLTLRTLADGRELMCHLPVANRERRIWQHVASELEKGDTGCGNKGATIQHSGWAGEHIGFLPFPT